MLVSLCCFRLLARELHPYPLYRSFIVRPTDLVRQVIALVASFLSRSSTMESCFGTVNPNYRRVFKHWKKERNVYLIEGDS